MSFYSNIGMSREVWVRKYAQKIYRHYKRFYTIFSKEKHKMQMGEKFNSVLANIPPSLTCDYGIALSYPVSGIFAGVASIEYMMKHYISDIPEVDQYLKKQESYIRRSKTRFNECIIEAFLLNNNTLHFHYCSNFTKYSISHRI